MGENHNRKLSKKQKKLLRHLKSEQDIGTILDSCNISESEVKFWRETNKKFDESYLEAIGLTRVQEQFLELFPKKVFNVTATCKSLKIHRSTYYSWMDKSDTFYRSVVDSKEGFYDDVESALLKKIFRDEDTRAMIYFSRTRMKHRGYTLKDEKDIRHSCRNCIENPYSKLSDEDLNRKIFEYENKLKPDI